MTEADDDQPLDPAAERLRRKLMGLLAVSSGIMAVGLLTVVIAIIYRVSQAAPAPTPTLALPISADAVASATVTERSLVLVVTGADPRIEVRNLVDGSLTQTIRLTGGDAPDN